MYAKVRPNYLLCLLPLWSVGKIAGWITFLAFMVVSVSLKQIKQHLLSFYISLRYIELSHVQFCQKLSHSQLIAHQYHKIQTTFTFFLPSSQNKELDQHVPGPKEGSLSCKNVTLLWERQHYRVMQFDRLYKHLLYVKCFGTDDSSCYEDRIHFKIHIVFPYI